MLEKQQYCFVVLGDRTTSIKSGIGGDKTAFAALLGGKPSTQQLFDEGTITKTLGTESVTAKVVNTAGSENMQTRFASLGVADVFILLFAISKKKSYENIKTKWVWPLFFEFLNLQRFYRILSSKKSIQTRLSYWWELGKPTDCLPRTLLLLLMARP